MATKSIIAEDLNHCIICGSPYDIEIHHACFGVANRKWSDKYGLVVPLCIEHHRGRTGVHQNIVIDTKIKQLAQTNFEEKVGSREEFMKIFGRNYL